MLPPRCRPTDLAVGRATRPPARACVLSLWLHAFDSSLGAICFCNLMLVYDCVQFRAMHTRVCVVRGKGPGAVGCWVPCADGSP